MLRGRGRVIAVPPASSFKLLIESKIVNDSQFPLPVKKGAEINVEIDDEKIILRRVSQV